METACVSAEAECRPQIYGWDARSQTWSGPYCLSPLRVSRRLRDALRNAPGRSWYGRVNSGAADQEARFFVLMHALGDCAVALIYCDDSKSGPAEIVMAIPPRGSARLRPDFAFEAVAFARFLGAIGEGDAQRVDELMAAAISTAPREDALVFSISTGLWTSDLDYLLSNCVEQVATAALEWLAERELNIPSACPPR